MASNEYSGPSDPTRNMATIIPADPVLTTPAVTRTAAHSIPTPPPVEEGALLDHVSRPKAPDSLRIFLTGGPRVGKTFICRAIGATETALTAPVWDLIKVVYCDELIEKHRADFSALAAQLARWGNGEISKDVPLTPARMAVTRMAQEKGWETWGAPGFLRDLTISFARDYPGPVVITGVTTLDDYKALQEAGFEAWHVVCGAAALKSRYGDAKLVPDALTVALNKSVNQQLAGARVAAKLHCVWSDIASVPSARIHSLDSFVSTVCSAPEAPAISVE
jgi:hypothetical protein